MDQDETNAPAGGNWTKTWTVDEFENPWLHAHPVRRRAQRRRMLGGLSGVAALIGLLTLISPGSSPLTLPAQVHVVRSLPPLTWSPPRWGAPQVSVVAALGVSPAVVATPAPTTTTTVALAADPAETPVRTVAPQAPTPGPAPPRAEPAPAHTTPPAGATPAQTTTTPPAASALPTTPGLMTLPTWCVLTVCV